VRWWHLVTGAIALMAALAAFSRIVQLEGITKYLDSMFNTMIHLYRGVFGQ
jgi:hypothetical protein